MAQVDNKLKKKICFTMRPKTLDFIEIKDTSKKNPGPASYEFVEAFPKTGKCYLSKFTSSKYAILSKSDRFNKTKESPGPQSYIIRDNFPKEGKYVQSKHMGQGTRPFSHAARRGFTDTISRDNICTCYFTQLLESVYTNNHRNLESTETQDTTKLCRILAKETKQSHESLILFIKFK